MVVVLTLHTDDTIEPSTILTVFCMVVSSKLTRHLYVPMSEDIKGLVHFNMAEMLPDPEDVCSESIPLGRRLSFLSHCTLGDGHANALHVRAAPV